MAYQKYFPSLFGLCGMVFLIFLTEISEHLNGIENGYISYKIVVVVIVMKLL